VVLAAQNGVTVSNLAVDAGTVTFNVSWDKNSDVLKSIAWVDSVWVFVDYNDAGVMQRLQLTGATLTNPSWSGASITQPNTQGAWVAGNARSASAGSFSATVQLLTATADIAGACVYASNYPPVAEYREGKIFFTGTPNYKIVFEGTGGTFNGISDGTYTIVAGEIIDSFTDKTGAPGEIKCLPSTVYELAASASGFCPGDSVTFTLSNAAAGRVYRLYNGSEAVDELNGQDAAATFTGAFAGEGIYTARVDADGTHCAVAMNGPRTITANALPTAPTIAKPADVCYNGDPLVFEATGYSGALTWTAVTTGGTVSGSSVTYASGAENGTKTVKARSSQTYNGAPACESNEVQQTAEVYALPARPTLTVTTGAGLTPATFTATGGSGSYQWNGYFDGYSGAVTYTPAEEGTYTAAVRSEEMHDYLVCASSYTAPQYALVLNIKENGAPCTLNADCRSGNCRCGYCTSESHHCLNGFQYFTVQNSTVCPDNYTAATTCQAIPYELRSIIYFYSTQCEYTAECAPDPLCKSYDCINRLPVKYIEACQSQYHTFINSLCYRKL
jgi:hypothetical protein